jgi:mannosyltransferase OCH1-like enzyme
VIPHVLHQVWVGPDPLPDEHRRYRETWARHHPRWELRLWSDSNLPTKVARPEIHERLRHPVERSDLLRYELLRQFGGVYVDTDFECLRPIDPLLEGTDFFVQAYSSGLVATCIMGSVPGHPLVTTAIREATPVAEFGYKKEAAGPPFFNRLVQQYGDVTMFGPEYFHTRVGDAPEGTYAIHHKARSHKTAEEWRVAALRAEARLAKCERNRARAETRLQQLKARPNRWERAARSTRTLAAKLRRT